MANSIRLIGCDRFNHLERNIIAAIQRLNLFQASSSIKVDGHGVHGSSSRTTFVMRASTGFQEHFPRRKIDSQYATIDRLRERKAFKECTTIKGLDPIGIPGYVTNPCSHTHCRSTGLL